MIISQELKDEEHADHVKYEKFEPYMLKGLFYFYYNK